MSNRSSVNNRIYSLFLLSKSLIRESLNRILARFGFVLFRFRSGIPPSLQEYLQNLLRRGIHLDAIFCFDSEADVETDFLSIFPSSKVSTLSYPSRECVGRNAPGMVSQAGPTGRFLVEIDAEVFDLEWFSRNARWIFAADVLLIRSSPNLFWSGKRDSNEMTRLMQEKGFNFYDVLQHVRIHLINDPPSRIVLVFEKKGPLPPASQTGVRRSRRVTEGLTCLSKPIASFSDLLWLAGRGSFGFPAGVYNPGAIAAESHTVLLARGERSPWVIAKKDEIDFLYGCRPVLLELNEDLSIVGVGEASFENGNQLGESRMEDFRLFRYRDQVFSNHSQITVPNIRPLRNRPVRLEALKTRVGLSQVDLSEKKLTFLGHPKIDQPIGLTEKNWVFFEHKKELYLIYSFSPYHLLQANRWPDMDFHTVLKCPVKLPIGTDQIQIRNSVNPVHYDDQYFLHVIHKMYSVKQYAFWAILIDKKSLIPTMVSSRPLIRGWHSAPASTIYACSVIPRNTEIYVFGGINDSSTGVWRISRSKLDAAWVPLKERVF
jgi:hypothetical protein